MLVTDQASPLCVLLSTTSLIQRLLEEFRKILHWKTDIITSNCWQKMQINGSVHEAEESVEWRLIKSLIKWVQSEQQTVHPQLHVVNPQRTLPQAGLQQGVFTARLCCCSALTVWQMSPVSSRLHAQGSICRIRTLNPNLSTVHAYIRQAHSPSDSRCSKGEKLNMSLLIWKVKDFLYQLLKVRCVSHSILHKDW